MKKYNLDEVDHQILDMLIDNARTPFTDIAKKIIGFCRNHSCSCQENGRGGNYQRVHAHFRLRKNGLCFYRSHWSLFGKNIHDQRSNQQFETDSKCDGCLCNGWKV